MANKLMKKVFGDTSRYSVSDGKIKVKSPGIFRPQYYSLFVDPFRHNPYKLIDNTEPGASILHPQYSQLFDNLIKNDKKKKVFKLDMTRLIGYPTPFPVSDWLNGYLVKVPDALHPGKYLEVWPNTGTFSGQFIMVIGNSNTGKSAYCIQSGSHIVKNFKNGLFLHIDGEHSSSPERVIKLNHYTPDEYERSYKFLECDTVESLFSVIMDLATEKFTNAQDYLYDTGHLDATGKPFMMLEPTVILIDALPSLQTNEVYDSEGQQSSEMMGQTYDMRLARAYNSFYKRLRPIIHRANIIVYAINHIKDRPNTGQFAQQSKIQYLRRDESIPGGTGPIYLSQTLYRFVYKKMKKLEDDGFDGFEVAVQCWKSKTNRSNTSFNLMYDHAKGFDPWRSMLGFLDTAGVVEGRNPYRYFKHEPDIKFSTKNFPAEIEANPKLIEALNKEAAPLLHILLGENEYDPNEVDVPLNKLSELLKTTYGLEEENERQTVLDG